MLYSSKDFGKVPPYLVAKLPDNLIQRNVVHKQETESKVFSAEREHFVNIVDLPSRVMSMTIGGLLPQQSTRKHRHNYETLIYIIKGKGKSIIEDREVIWQESDAIYIPVWAWHQHINTTTNMDCLYVACENAPLLLNLGELALREESQEG